MRLIDADALIAIMVLVNAVTTMERVKENERQIEAMWQYLRGGKNDEID